MHFRQCLVAICLSAVLAINLVEAKSVRNTQQQPQKDIIVVKDIRDFVKSHPGLQLVRMTKDQPKARSTSVRYSLGGRVTGDSLVASDQQNYAYPALKDVTLQLTYPEAGTGSVVTYVEIICQQDSTDGNAYIVAGGIGQRFISIVLEANQTEIFTYVSQIYGVN